MRLVIYIILFVQFNYAYSQWNKIDLGTTNRIYALEFLNNSTGYIIGDNGMYVKTTDDGETWVDQVPFTSKILTSLGFVNDSIHLMSGVDLGATMSLYRSNNAGNNWEEYLTQIYERPSQIKIYKNYGYMMTYNPNITKMFQSKNYGETWEVLDSVPYQRFTHYVIVDTNDIWVCGINGYYCHYTNGNKILDSSFSTTIDLFEINFVTDSIRFVTGSQGSIFKSTDAGKTWSLKNQGINPEQIVYSVRFKNQSIGWAVSFIQPIKKSTIYKTTDCGETWSVDQIIDGYYLNDLSLNDKYIWVFGLEGALYRHNIATDIEEITDKHYLFIYPNPAKGYLELNYVTDGLISEIKVNDLNGNMVLKEINKKNRIDISNLPSGVYYLRAKVGNQYIITKFIKME